MMDPEIGVVCHFWKRGPPRRFLPGDLRFLPFLLTVTAVLLVPLGALAAEAPSFDRPFGDWQTEAGTTIAGAARLSEHFSAPGGEPITYGIIESVDGAAPDSDGPFLRANDGFLDIVAAHTAWTGSARFQVEACTGSGIEVACVRSNVFTILVTAAPFSNPGLNPVGTELRPSADLNTTIAGDSVSVDLRLDDGVPIYSVPRWYLDNEFVGEGQAIHVRGLAAGDHIIEARYIGADGPVTVKRVFTTMLPPTKSGFATGQIAAFGLAGILLGAVAVVGRTAKFRRPLVLIVVNSIYTRLKSESLLDHFNRGALHQVIKENPGIHFSELRRRVGISHGSAVYHLRALEKGGYIQVVATGAYTRYFSTGEDLEDATYGLSPADTNLLAAVVASPGISLADLSSHTGRTLGTTSRAVSRLVSLGYVTTERSRRKRLVYPRPGRVAPPESAQPNTVTDV